ncbi:MAG TPA: ComEC/Rec2 family competence protein, partial [Planctomycetota bacterium]|nr:ComEC/Rec2 family competence protein [Planctomycetota bacterium]
MNAPAVTFSVGLMIGILSARGDLRTGLLFAILAGTGLVVLYVLRRLRPAVARLGSAGVIALLGAVAGALLGARHYHVFPADHVRNIAGDDRQNAIVEGRIVDEPVLRTYQYLKWTSLRVEAEAVTIRGVRRPATGLVAAFVSVEGGPEPAYGQRVRLSGQLSRPEGPQNPGEVDRRATYANERIYATLSVAKYGTFEVIDPAAGNPLLAAIFRLKAHLRAALAAAAPGEAGVFLDSILLGRRDALDDALVEDFVRTNTIHVLAVSGLHLAVLWTVLFTLLTRILRIPHKPAIVVVLAFAVLHCAVTGASPSILRATIMVGIVAVGRLVAQEPRTLNSLAIAAIAILARDAGDLFNVGFQLSFTAILGLQLLFVPMKASFVGLFPPLGARAGWRRRIAFLGAWSLGDAVLVAFAAWLATGPLILWQYHLVSPGTIPANLAVAVPVWIVLGAGMLALIAAPAGPLVAAPFVAVAGLGAFLLVKIVRSIAAWPGTYFYLPDVHGAQVLAAYAALGALAWAGSRRWRPRWLVALAPAMAVAVLVPVARERVPAGEARVAVLSVGKGATTVVRTAESTVLFDCGAGKIVEPGARFVAPYLWRAGVRAIDAVFISHAHDDHMNALLALADRFRIGRVYVNPA